MVSSSARPAPPNQFYADTFESVEITSDLDFDPSHPAGSSLADIVRLRTLSPYPYIKSGYTPFDWDNYQYRDELGLWFSPVFTSPNLISGPGCLYPVRKLVSELVPEDLYLLGQGMDIAGGPLATLEFVSHPAVLQSVWNDRGHIITVTLTDSDGNRFSNTVEVSFYDV